MAEGPTVREDDRTGHGTAPLVGVGSRSTIRWLAGFVPAGGRADSRPIHQEEGYPMNAVFLHEVRGGFFLLVGFAMLAFICALAALGTVMRPVRWADRRTAQF